MTGGGVARCDTAGWAGPDELAQRAPRVMQPRPNSVTAAVRATIRIAVMA
jgi:hypothetical protein